MCKIALHNQGSIIMTRRIFQASFITALMLVASGCSTSMPAGPDDQTGEASGPNLYDDFMAEERQWAGLVTRRVTVGDGMKIAYSESSNASGPVLILLHGYYGDRNNWNRVAHLLGDRYHLIIPDLPGHGDTDPDPDNRYTFGKMASVMIDFIDALGIDKFHLAGHSMGGGLAIQWSVLDFGQEIQSLILIGSAGVYANNTSPIMERILAGDNPMRIAQPGDAHKVLDIAMSLPPFIPERVMKAYESKQIARLPIYDKVMSDMLGIQEHISPDFFYVGLERFDRPALVIWGREDKLFSVETAGELASALPDATKVIIDGVGHTPLLEAAWPTAQAMGAFLVEVSGRQPLACCARGNSNCTLPCSEAEGG
jgi:triacylglycerol lipase